jgi:DNA-binding NtrC family response regulator
MTEFSGIRILLVDDDEVLLRLLEKALFEAGARVQIATCLSEMHKNLAKVSFDAIFLDLGLGCERGVDAISNIVAEYPDSKLVILTGTSDIEIAAQCITLGASSVIRKRSCISETMIEIRQVLKGIVSNTNQQPEAESQSFGIVGSSAPAAALRASISQLADVDSTVLILGESGTGKELVARGLHSGSLRRERRFEALNCAAIPEALLESELFGHKRGAFTDAKADRKGLFEVCSGGTLFLDEIGEMPLNIQSKLLRVLQERVVRPIGSSNTVSIDARIIAATNRDLRTLVKEGGFREDLFFRLAVIPLSVPPLRDRSEDIPELVSHFLTKFNQRFGRSISYPSHDLMIQLTSYAWGGNIRELQNAIERGVVLARGNELKFENLMLNDQIPAFENGDKSFIVGRHPELETLFGLPLTAAKNQFEMEYIRQAIEGAGGNISEAARRCGRYRTDLYRLMGKYGIEYLDA